MDLIILVIVIVLILIVHTKFMSDDAIVEIVDMLGQWAVVTGATDGIGKAFARELARMGYDIVLVSRNQTKLEITAQEIESDFKVDTKIIRVDFATADEDVYAKVASELQNIDVGILVNNVGSSVCHPEGFLKVEKHLGTSYQAMLNVNITSMIRMTGITLPKMVEKRKGLIVNVSSLCAIMPVPGYTVYGATKNFISKFSQDLNLEYSNTGVHVHVLTTGAVATKMSGVDKTSFFCPSPQIYVKSALKQVTRKSCCDGYIGHTILNYVVSVAVFVFPEIFGNLINKLMKYVKNKGEHRHCQECCSAKMK